MFAFDYLSVTVSSVRYTTLLIVNQARSKHMCDDVADTRVVLFSLALGIADRRWQQCRNRRRHILFDLFCYRSSK